MPSPLLALPTLCRVCPAANNSAFAAGTVASTVAATCTTTTGGVMSCAITSTFGRGRELLSAECDSKRVPFVIGFTGTGAQLSFGSPTNATSGVVSMACDHPYWAIFAWEMLSGSTTVDSGNTTSTSATLSLSARADGPYSVRVMRGFQRQPAQ